MRKYLLALFLTVALSHSYAQDLSKGHTFTDGDTVHASDLNTLVDSATILPTFLSNKATATPLTTDIFLFDQASTSTLKTVSLANLLGAGSAVVTTTTRTANTFLGGPNSGAAAAPTFRVLTPADTSDATNTAGGTTVDCSIARTFSRTLAGNTTYTLTNISDGETVTVAIKQAASGGPYTAAFTVAGGITWRGGTAPTQTTTANKTDLFTFIHIGSVVYGTASQNY
jgi:hypothetical protein